MSMYGYGTSNVKCCWWGNLYQDSKREWNEWAFLSMIWLWSCLSFQYGSLLPLYFLSSTPFAWNWVHLNEPEPEWRWSINIKNASIPKQYHIENEESISSQDINIGPSQATRTSTTIEIPRIQNGTYLLTLPSVGSWPIRHFMFYSTSLFPPSIFSHFSFRQIWFIHCQWWWCYAMLWIVKSIVSNHPSQQHSHHDRHHH